jgi:hypothetical protein
MKGMTEMRKVFATLAVFMLAGSVGFAQTPQGLVIQQTRVQGPPGAPLPPTPDGNFLFIAAEGFEGKVVKGAPYAGEAVTEHVQVLGDGNRIVNKFSSSVYRDSEGRTRREQTLKGLNMLGSNQEPMQTIFITDPVAGVTYSLDSRSQTAIKSVPFKVELGPKGMVGSEGRRFEFRVAPSGEGTMIMTSPEGSAPAPMSARIAVQRSEQFSVDSAGTAGAGYVFRRVGPSPNASEVKLDLGKQIIEGVEAEGKRNTITIPAGEMGNERPIEIVSERWYSPELQLVVMTRLNDPRSGETIYKLTNINRSEPAKSLFEVPAGYTVRDSIHLGGPMIPRTRKLANPEEQ